MSRSWADIEAEDRERRAAELRRRGDRRVEEFVRELTEKPVELNRERVTEDVHREYASHNEDELKRILSKAEIDRARARRALGRDE